MIYEYEGNLLVLEQNAGSFEMKERLELTFPF